MAVSMSVVILMIVVAMGTSIVVEMIGQVIDVDVIRIAGYQMHRRR